MPRLSKLLMEVKRGEILIPRFQRPFVWTDDQRIQLMESIYSGFPIGSLLVWRTQTHKLATYDRLGPLLMPQAQTGETTRQYLLDGHQRLVTLFAALGPGLYGPEEQGPEWGADAKARWRWPIYFDLKEGTFCYQQGFGTPPVHWVPINKLFDSFVLVEIKEQIRAEGFDRTMVNRVDALAETFRDYAVPVLPIATEDMGQATASFMRINSGGTVMSEVHMVNALAHERLDLMREIEAIQEALKPVGWHELEPQKIFDVCKSRLGLSPFYKDPEAIAGELGERPELLAGVKEDILKVANVLDRIAGVRSPQSLPYGLHIVLLAHALRGIDLSVELLSVLRLWFWSTTLTQHLRGVNWTLLSLEALHLGEMVKNKMYRQSPGLVTVVDKVRVFELDEPRLLTLGLLLAELKPIDPTTGRMDDDPFDLLAEFGVGAFSKLFEPAELHGWEWSRFENLFLVHPRKAALFKKAICEEQNIDEAVLASHSIDHNALDALRQKDWLTLLNARRKSIEALEAARAAECGLTYQSSED